MPENGPVGELSPIEQRGGKWSPLALGLFSVVCDPFLMSTVMAFSRGLAELREVARREASGYWSPEHARVRSGAVWGMVIASSRIVFVALAVATSLLMSALEAERAPPAHAPFGTDELVEIRQRLASEDGAVRALAARHLMEMAPTLIAPEPSALLASAEQQYPPASGDAPHVPSAIVRACAEARDLPDGADDLARLRRLYPTFDPAGRSAALTLLARVAWTHDDIFAWQELLELAASEREAVRGLHLPIDVLARVAEARPERFAGAWEHIDTGSPFSADLVTAAALYCERDDEGDRSPAAYAGGLARARERWPVLREALSAPPAEPGLAGLLSPQRARDAHEAASIVAVLGCDAVHPDLETAREAAQSSDPRVALAAVRVLEAAGEPVSDATFQRLAREPLVRLDVYALLGYPSDPLVRGIPWDTWSEVSLAESRFIAKLDTLDLDYVPHEIRARPPVQWIWIEDDESWFAVFDVIGTDTAGAEVHETGISGLYPAGSSPWMWNDAETWLVRGTLDDGAVDLEVLRRFGGHGEEPRERR